MPPRTFKALFCERFGCAPEEYEREAFRECLHRRGRLAAPVIEKVWPDIFEEDYGFIRQLGAATSVREAAAEAANFQDTTQSARGFWRVWMKIRVSGRRAARLAGHLFAELREKG